MGTCQMPAGFCGRGSDAGTSPCSDALIRPPLHLLPLHGESNKLHLKGQMKKYTQAAITAASPSAVSLCYYDGAGQPPGSLGVCMWRGHMGLLAGWGSLGTSPGRSRRRGSAEERKWKQGLCTAQQAVMCTRRRK